MVDKRILTRYVQRNGNGKFLKACCRCTCIRICTCQPTNLHSHRFCCLTFAAGNCTSPKVPHIDLSVGCSVTVLIIESSGKDQFIAQPYAPDLIQLMGAMRYVQH